MKNILQTFGGFVICCLQFGRIL